MRNRVILLTAALLLASLPGMAQTQQPTPTPTPTAADFPWKGLIDFGGAFGSGYDGDEARYERYRDTRNGVYSDIALSHDGPTYAANFEASHIGYRDQRWVAGMEAGRGGFNFIYDSIPTNYLYGAFSPWDLGSATLTLNDVYQGERRPDQRPDRQVLARHHFVPGPAHGRLALGGQRARSRR